MLYKMLVDMLWPSAKHVCIKVKACQQAGSTRAPVSYTGAWCSYSTDANTDWAEEENVLVPCYKCGWGHGTWFYLVVLALAITARSTSCRRI